MAGQPTDEPRSEAPQDDGNADNPDGADARYKRRIGVTLALLTIVGAWIAVMATDASTSEATAAREATRQAVEAQSADVLAKGVRSAAAEARAQVDSLGSRAIFADPVVLGEDLGIDVDEAAARQRTETAQAAVASSLDGSGPDVTELSRRANALSLQQSATVESRITWNAKASQYETVLTVLAISIFLVGFTLVIGRRLRPPIAVPAVLLAVFCAGWAALIWSHEVPSVPPKAIDATAVGQTAIAQGRADEAHTAFSEALESKSDYVAALRGRALASLLEANPDLLRTLAVTNSSPAVVEPAVADIVDAMEAGGDQDPETMAVAGLAATLAGRWNLASSFIDDAIELNETAVELYLWHAAVDIARERPEAAQGWLDRATDRFGDLGADRTRSAVAQYLSLLEVVNEKDPERAELAERFARQAVATATQLAVDRPLDAGDAPEVTFEVRRAEFTDDTTTLAFDLDGLDDDTAVAIVGYEQPTADAAWVQPPELFYAGTVAGRGDGVEVDTPRNCAPVAYRFDLYVEGELRASRTAPGVAATC